MKRTLFFLALATTFLPQAQARENIRELFKDNSAIIYTLNIRNFGAVDKNNDGIIDIDDGDIKGTFLNAKDKLKNLSYEGINTLYLLPITKTGKLKALGTAGSLYAIDSFDEIAPELDDLSNPKTVYEEAKEFVEEAHKNNLNVILDLPSCGSYDLSIKKPDWFLKDLNNKNEALIPADWTDVRLFKVYNEDKTINQENLDNFKKFIDMAQNLGFDGIRADVAAIKPYEFWKELIDYSRKKDKNFLFLAEANPEWSNPASNGVSNYSSIDELLKAGFDSYYGSFSDFKNIKTKKEFDKKITQNLEILKRNKNKSIIGAFATHDQQAPSLRGKNYWNMILWLNTTLPLNSYFLDGFSYGDDFTYPYENKKAKKTYTDDEFYFVHSGMFDIFNFSAPIRQKHPEFRKNYLKALDFKERNSDLIKNGKFSLLKTNNDKVFAYSIINEDRELIVVGSLDENSSIKTEVTSKYLKKDHVFLSLNAKNIAKTEKNKMTLNLEPLEIQVYLISLASLRAM